MQTKQLLAINRNWNVADAGLLLFRVMLSGSLFLHHGWEKLSRFSAMAQHFPDPLHIGMYPSLAYATFADGVCTLLVILGLATRVASFFILVNLAVVFFIVEQALSFGRAPLPGPPGMLGPPPGSHTELVFVYLAGYLLLTLAGSGRFSIDAKID